jgi:predicted DNA-binding helix-hairpin-helix protein
MDPLEKLKAVSQTVQVEDPEQGGGGRVHTCDSLPVFNAVVSGGGCIRLLKSLLTSVCENNCA